MERDVGGIVGNEGEAARVLKADSGCANGPTMPASEAEALARIDAKHGLLLEAPDHREDR
jgi:hypothetical protein